MNNSPTSSEANSESWLAYFSTLLTFRAVGNLHRTRIRHDLDNTQALSLNLLIEEIDRLILALNQLHLLKITESSHKTTAEHAHFFLHAQNIAEDAFILANECLYLPTQTIKLMAEAIEEVRHTTQLMQSELEKGTTNTFTAEKLHDSLCQLKKHLSSELK